MNVFARVVRATPHRPADEAWDVIVGLLAPNGGAARDELMKVAGVATSLIASEAPKNDKIVVWGGGPACASPASTARTRSPGTMLTSKISPGRPPTATGP